MEDGRENVNRTEGLNKPSAWKRGLWSVLPNVRNLSFCGFLLTHTEDSNFTGLLGVDPFLPD